MGFVIELRMMDGTKFYLGSEQMKSFGVQDDPYSYVYACIAGTRGGMLQAFTTSALTGDKEAVNPRMIVSMKVTYTA